MKKIINLKLVIISNWSEEVFVIKKVKDTVPWTYVIEAINEEERLTKKECKKQIKQSLKLKK